MSEKLGSSRYAPTEADMQALSDALGGVKGISKEEVMSTIRASGATEDEYFNAADATSEADRIWFEQHPGVNEYIRPMATDEIMRTWAPPGWHVTGGVTLVKQIFPGARVRRQLHINTEPVGGRQ